LPSPIGVGRFVIRATHERGVGVPPSRSLATASHEAKVTLAHRTDKWVGLEDRHHLKAAASRSYLPLSNADTGAGCHMRPFGVRCPVEFSTRAAVSLES
jgi:hypothetical protein